MRNGKGSLRRPMAIKPEVFADNFARSFGNLAGTLKTHRTPVHSTDTGTQGSGRDGATRGSENSGR
jgi:hypothetical protein